MKLDMKLNLQKLDSAPATPRSDGSPRGTPRSPRRTELPTPQERAAAADVEVQHRVSVVSTPLFTGWTAGANGDQYAAAADAAATGQGSQLKTLLEGLDINHQHPLNGTTLLLESCAQAQYSIAALLISSGAQVNLANNAGFTPLMVAARWGGANTVRVLLTYGADVSLTMPDGKTALDLALAARHDLESHSKSEGRARRSNERVDSCYLLQRAEDEAWEREEAKAMAALEKVAQAEVARATWKSASAKAAADDEEEQANADAENDEAQQRLTPRSQRNISRRQRLQASLKDVAAKLEVQASSTTRTKKAAGAA